MKKKSWPVETATVQPPEWGTEEKEAWFLEFEKEPVNDEKWSCIVTGAIPNEAEDEECIQTYIQCVSSGIRKAVKVISMADVVKLLKGNNGGSKKEVKNVKVEKVPRKSPVKSRGQRLSQVVELAGKYATFVDTECRLHPELMAAVLKYMILNLKEESCLRKRVDAVGQRKIREQRLREKFIRDLNPYEPGQEERKYGKKVSPNILELEEPINDEPVAGPDLYIMLTDFYNELYYPELQKWKVPFIAVLRISTEPNEENDIIDEADVEIARKRSRVVAFWEKLQEECFALSSASKFKDIAVVEYTAPVQGEDPREYYGVLFNELTWTQYSVYCIYRQHQRYLQELHVQRLIQPSETLDLSKCDVYNMLCDALVSGEPITPLLVLYAIIEQIVAGVPHTEGITLEYHPHTTDFFPSSNVLPDSTEDTSALSPVPMVTPCQECRGKKYESFCDKLKQPTDSFSQLSEGDEWPESSEENSFTTQADEYSLKTTRDSETASSTSETFKSLITKVLTERKTEKEMRDEKRWKTPGLSFYGDSIYLQTYFCDPRLFHRETIVDRFLKNSSLPLIWTHFPELSTVEKAYYNFHFGTLLKMSKHSEEVLKLHIFFLLAMKLIGRTLYIGGGPGTGGDKWGCSDTKLNQKLLSLSKGEERTFRNYFLKTFIAGLYLSKIGVQSEDVTLESTGKTDTQSKGVSVSPQTTNSSDEGLRRRDSNFTSSNEKTLTNFYSLLNCFQISNLAVSDIPITEDFSSLVQDFKFFENLEPNFMIQRLIEAKESFNDAQVSYFPPTDTLVLLLYNDFDGRRILCQSHTGVIHTPVGLRDFYHYVYPEITGWLIDEEAEYAKFESELMEKERAKEEKMDAEFLDQLKRKYCSMSEEKKAEFRAGNLAWPHPEVKEKALRRLPVKPKPKNPDRVSFFVTNITDIRVETEEKVREFYSKDGTQVSAFTDSWLYDSVELLRVRIKRSNFSLYYNQWLGHPPTTNFTLKTNSGIIFSFWQDDNSMTISWPTGLLIRPAPLGFGIYIRQGYLKPYRKGWDIEEEKSRCFLPNGQLLVFRDNGDYDILFGSGTKYSFYDATVPRYEITSTTGEVWQVRTKGPCKNKKTLMTINKIFLGVDPNTKETFYKREDGTCCMLWPSGRLVTNYPDGTKITTTPYFETEEVTTDWTEEEKLHYGEIVSRHKSENAQRSRTILRNSGTPRPGSRGHVDNEEVKNFHVEGFIPVSCSYLMEHPKYSRVHFDSKDPYVRVTMPEQITVLMHPEGIYEVQQDANFLKADDGVVEFYTECPDCKEKSSVKLNLNSSDVVCKCIDFFQQAFFVYRNGQTNFHEYYPEGDSEGMAEVNDELLKSRSNTEKCRNSHTKNQSLMQRCFAFQRDLSGIEFLHMGSLSFHFYQLPEETYFELNTEDVFNICHTSNRPYYKLCHEKWVMDYEESNNSLPKNIKKKDLKELGVKQVTRNTFKFPFPKHHNCGNPQQSEKVKRVVNEPKVVVSRTIWCLSQNPNGVLEELRQCAEEYEKKTVAIFREYRKHKVADDRTSDSRYVEMRLRKIALTLSQNLQMYPHLCTSWPSTEKDIHYFGHFINTMQGLKGHVGDDQGLLPNCKQIPGRLPRSSDFTSILEESE